MRVGAVCLAALALMVSACAAPANDVPPESAPETAPETAAPVEEGDAAVKPEWDALDRVDDTCGIEALKPFLGTAAADQALLDRGWCVLVNGQATDDDGADGGASRLAELQCRSGVARNEDLLDGNLVWLPLQQDFAYAFEDLAETGRECAAGSTDAAGIQVPAAYTIGLDDAVAGHP